MTACIIISVYDIHVPTLAIMGSKSFWMSFSFHFSFFVLVDKVTKHENRLCDFLYNIFRLQDKTGRKKWKIIKQTNKLLRNIFGFFGTFVNQKEKEKMGWKAQKSPFNSYNLCNFTTFFKTFFLQWNEKCIYHESVEQQKLELALLWFRLGLNLG